MNTFRCDRGVPEATSTPSPECRQPIVVIGVALVIAAVVAYANTFSVPFAFDDKTAILENPTIRSLWPLSGPFSPPAIGSGVTGRPLVNASLALNYALGGTSVFGYHVFNVVVHALSALLLFHILRRTFRSRPLAERFGASADILGGLIAMVWAVHPLLTESVTSVIQRTESFLAFWYLLTLYAFIRGAAAPHGARRWQVAAVVSCACGMLTKEVMVTAPVLLFFYDRTFLAGTFRGAWRERKWVHLGFAATWLILAVLVVGMGGSRGVAAGVGLGVSVGDYVLTQFHAIALYLKLSVWPHPLVFDYGWEVARSVGEVFPPMLLVVGLAVATLVALWRAPVLGFAGLWFFGILAPSSSVVPLVEQTIAEHRMYLPLIAVVALLGALLYRAMGRGSFVALGLAVPVLLCATLARNRDYRTEIALWTDTAQKAPTNPRALSNKAEILIALGRGPEALSPAAEAGRLRPNYPEALNNLAIALAQSGRLEEAVPYYESALKLRPTYAAAHSNLGAALAQLGHVPEAVAHLEKALQLSPHAVDVPRLRNNLGSAYLQSGRVVDAIAQYRIVVQLAPQFADAHYNLGLALAQAGRTEEAVAEIQTVLRLKPDHPAAPRALEILRGRL